MITVTYIVLGIAGTIAILYGIFGPEIHAFLMKEKATVKNTLDVNNDGKVNLEDVKVAAKTVEEKVKKVAKKKAMKVKK